MWIVRDDRYDVYGSVDGPEAGYDYKAWLCFLDRTQAEIYIRWLRSVSGRKRLKGLRAVEMVEREGV